MDIQTAIYRYCNYQERCHQEVRNKLYELGANTEEVNSCLAELIEANLLNEERFACSYVRGKFGQKKWGRNKIRMGLKAKKVSDYCIRKGLAEIDGQAYERTLYRMAEQALTRYHKHPVALREMKTQQYLASRGYEWDLIKDVLKELAHAEKQEPGQQ